jgi:hypothetical protein
LDGRIRIWLALGVGLLLPGADVQPAIALPAAPAATALPAVARNARLVGLARSARPPGAGS